MGDRCCRPLIGPLYSKIASHQLNSSLPSFIFGPLSLDCGIDALANGFQRSRRYRSSAKRGGFNQITLRDKSRSALASNATIGHCLSLSFLSFQSNFDFLPKIKARTISSCAIYQIASCGQCTYHSGMSKRDEPLVPLYSFIPWLLVH